MEKFPSKIEPIIRLNDVSIGYKKGEPLVQIPNLEIFPGEIVAIAGPSGVGKSTLLKTIAGLIDLFREVLKCVVDPFPIGQIGVNWGMCLKVWVWLDMPVYYIM